ncbi:MAG: hypothetical protein U1F64_01340 [Burkholderiales bacterium]
MSRTFQVQRCSASDGYLYYLSAREWNANYACGDSFGASGFMAGLVIAPELQWLRRM